MTSSTESSHYQSIKLSFVYCIVLIFIIVLGIGLWNTYQQMIHERISIYLKQVSKEQSVFIDSYLDQELKKLRIVSVLLLSANHKHSSDASDEDNKVYLQQMFNSLLNTYISLDKRFERDTEHEEFSLYSSDGKLIAGKESKNLLITHDFSKYTKSDKIDFIPGRGFSITHPIFNNEASDKKELAFILSLFVPVSMFDLYANSDGRFDSYIFLRDGTIQLSNGGNILDVENIEKYYNQHLRMQNKKLDISSHMVEGQLMYVVPIYESKYGFDWLGVITSDNVESYPIFANSMSRVVTIVSVLYSMLVITLLYLLFFTKRKNRVNKNGRFVDDPYALAKTSYVNYWNNELKTPLNVIKNMNELILRRSKDIGVVSYAKYINQANNYLQTVVNNISNFSKLEFGMLDFTELNYKISPIIKQIFEYCESVAKQKNIILSFNIDPSIPRVLNGDPVVLKQIIQNFIKYSMKFTNSGEIYLRFSLKEIVDNVATFNIYIKDNGEGIPSHILAKLNEELEKGSVSAKDEHSEVGVGILVSYNLIKKMNGSLKFSSEKGNGVEVNISIQQKVVDVTSIGEIMVNSDVSGERVNYIPLFTAPEAKILVVDDDEINRVVVEKLLEETKVDIYKRPDGASCVEMVQMEHFDLILLDMIMPNMSGLETLRHIRLLRNDDLNDYKKLPIVALTISSEEGAREKYIKRGFNDYISKPIVSKHLEQVIYKLLPKELIETDNSEKIMALENLQDELMQKVNVDKVKRFKDFQNVIDTDESIGEDVDLAEEQNVGTEATTEPMSMSQNDKEAKSNDVGEIAENGGGLFEYNEENNQEYDPTVFDAAENSVLTAGKKKVNTDFVLGFADDDKDFTSVFASDDEQNSSSASAQSDVDDIAENGGGLFEYNEENNQEYDPTVFDAAENSVLTAGKKKVNTDFAVDFADDDKDFTAIFTADDEQNSSSASAQSDVDDIAENGGGLFEYDEENNQEYDPSVFDAAENSVLTAGKNQGTQASETSDIDDIAESGGGLFEYDDSDNQEYDPSVFDAAENSVLTAGKNQGTQASETSDIDDIAESGGGLFEYDDSDNQEYDPSVFDAAESSGFARDKNANVEEYNEVNSASEEASDAVAEKSGEAIPAKEEQPEAQAPNVKPPINIEKVLPIDDYNTDIDQTTGLKFCGNSKKMYKNVLTMYAKQGGKHKNTLKESFEADDIANFTVVSHSLKSSSYTIGATSFGDFAKCMEFAGKDNDLEKIQANYDNFLMLYDQLLDNVIAVADSL